MVPSAKKPEFYVDARMSIAIVRAIHLCIRGSRIPTSKMSNRLPQWKDKAGLGLFRRKDITQSTSDSSKIYCLCRILHDLLVVNILSHTSTRVLLGSSTSQLLYLLLRTKLKPYSHRMLPTGRYLVPMHTLSKPLTKPKAKALFHRLVPCFSFIKYFFSLEALYRNVSPFLGNDVNFVCMSSALAYRL
jgi:hypothetical protein